MSFLNFTLSCFVRRPASTDQLGAVDDLIDAMDLEVQSADEVCKKQIRKSKLADMKAVKAVYTGKFTIQHSVLEVRVRNLKEIILGRVVGFIIL